VKDDFDIVTAFVVVVDRVQRLVQVAHEMHHEQQRFLAAFRACPRILQHGFEALQAGHDTLAFGAIAGHVEAAGSQRNVDVVPRPRIRPGAADFVRPTGNLGDRLPGPENFGDPDLRFAGKFLLRDACHQPVAFRSPAKGRQLQAHCGYNQKFAQISG
jgi:hypothetical protein